MGINAKVKRWAKIAVTDPSYLADVVGAKARKVLALDRRFGNGHAFGPKAIVATLTWRCNLTCLMCDQYGGDYKKPVSQLTNEDELTLDQWKKVIDDVAQYKPYINLFGGEPLLYKDAMEVLKYIKSKGLRCAITTNGTLLNRYGEEMITSGLDSIGISVDGPPEIHDRIRGLDGSFSKIRAGLLNLIELRKKHKSLTPRIQINFVVTRWNFDRVAEMAGLAKEIGVDGLTIQHLNFLEPETMKRHIHFFKEHFDYQWPIKSKDLNYLDTEPIDTKILHEQIALAKKTVGLPISVLPELDDPKDLEGYYHDINHEFERTACVNPWSHVQITPKGTVTPCMEFPLGNVRDTPFPEIWNNALFKKFRRELKKGGLFPGYCHRCCHRQFGSAATQFKSRYL